MRIAVLTCTRDREAYTRHCFAKLAENAGCEYDHYVLDQASEDGTPELLDQLFEAGPVFMWVQGVENVGIHRGWNTLIDEAVRMDDYDVFVTFDNDCELTDHGTLAALCEAVYPDSGWIACPTVLGLQNPLSPRGSFLANGLRIGETPIVGGICRAMPGSFVRDGFRFNETMPYWGGDESWIAQQFPGRVGWMLDWTVNHYMTTDGQQADQPGYFSRKFSEMGR